MGLFMDGDGIPLAFSLFPGNANEQTSLKPLEKKVLGDFGCQKFIYCSDAGLGSESIREYNHMGERAYIVTQSIKKLKKEEKEWALSPQGFKRVSDDKPVDITKLPEDDKGLYYKDEPYTTKKIHQRLIITYSPKYALYQKSIRDKQVERAQKMLDSGNAKKDRRTRMTRHVSLERRQLQKMEKLRISGSILMRIRLRKRHSMTGFMQYVRISWMMRLVIS